MSVFYVNANTSEIIERDEPSARLDGLDNWSRHESREAAEQAGEGSANLVIRDGVLHRPGMVAAPTIAPRGARGGDADAVKAPPRADEPAARKPRRSTTSD